jgi:hypothetical protein
MSELPPYSESDLDSPEYRDRLQRKLNYLITVLELAIGKVHRSLAGPDPDVERLLKIRKNLQDTLQVCVRARTALESRDELPSSLSSDLEKSVNLTQAFASSPTSALRKGVRAEMSSEEEHRRFQQLGRIDPREVRACDLDELARRLTGD